jgi:hypothetical protein
MSEELAKNVEYSKRLRYRNPDAFMNIHIGCEECKVYRSCITKLLKNAKSIKSRLGCFKKQ